VHFEFEGVRYINFCSNDYLGLTHHRRLLEAMRSAQSAGSGAAGLITGYTDLHARAEDAIARWKGAEAAVLLPSGYQANLAAVQTLNQIGGEASVRFLIDKLAHASLIDAVRATQAPMRAFPHNNLTKLRQLLDDAPADQLQVVLTESIFSMDGDACDLRGLAELKQKHPFVLLLDEAHGSGVYGPNGSGLAAEMKLQHAVDVSIVTLSKAIGCVGGAVSGSSLFRDGLLNFGRAYIYSTSVPPHLASCVTEAIGVMRDEPQRQARVRALANRVRSELKLEPGADSPIVPIVLGDQAKALHAAEEMKRRGLLVLAVRPPTVAPGSSRLRVTLSCEHSDEEIEQLIQAIRLLRA
jgi:8-amino-7-oxononanoate synthase